MARPTDYSEEIVTAAQAYFDLPRPSTDEVIPTIEGLALHLGIDRTTVYAWIKEEGKESFSHIVKNILQKQAKTLINNGLLGTFSGSITKVMLTKHGYREGIETSGPDGSALFPEKTDKDMADKALGSFIGPKHAAQNNNQEGVSQGT